MTTYGQAEAIIGSYRNTVTSVNREVQNFTARVNALKSPNIRVTIQQTSQLLKDIRTAIPASTEKLLAINKVAQTTVNDLPNGEQKNKLQNQLTVLDTAGATSVSQLNDLAVETTKIEKSLVDNSRPPISPPVPAPAPQRAQNKVSDDATPQNTSAAKPVAQGTNLNQEEIKNPSPSAPPVSNQALEQQLRNSLSKFSSYTYKLSMYALTADNVNDFSRTGKWDTSKLELMIQSGGMNTSLDAPRSKWFNYDFGIDNVEIVSIISSKVTGAATHSYDFKFQVFEPYAMTLPSRLVYLHRDLRRRSSIVKDIDQDIDAVNMPFLLVIRFFGYDANGELMDASDSVSLSPYTETNDRGAFERAFPLLITKLSFRLDNKVTVYDIQARLINEVFYGTKRGIVDAPITISADTVAAAIGGSPGTSNGLLDQINKHLKSLTGTNNEDKRIGLADEYRIVFKDASIANASMVDKNNWTKETTPLASVNNTSQVNAKKSVETTTASRSKRTFEVAPGTPILTAIDQIITQSTYVSDALKSNTIESPPPLAGERGVVNNPNPKKMFWYNITPSVEIIGQDPIRKDFAYRVTYYVNKYAVPFVKSMYIDGYSPYPGPKKIYNYYYSGQNTEILSYEQQYNLLYFTTIASVTDAGIEFNSTGAPAQPKPTTGADATGKKASKFELANTLKTYLYSPGDQLQARIRILGDPDFLLTSSDLLATRYFAPEGSRTITPDLEPVFIEIGFKQVEDYGVSGAYPAKFNNDGLLSPNNNIVFWDYPPEIAKQCEGRMIYHLYRITSRFNDGKFTQELTCGLPNFTNSSDSGGTDVEDKPRKETETQKQSNATGQPTRLTPQQIEKQVRNTEDSLRKAAQVTVPPYTRPQNSTNDDNNNVRRPNVGTTTNASEGRE